MSGEPAPAIVVRMTRQAISTPSTARAAHRRVHTVLAVGTIAGSLESLERVLDRGQALRADAVAVVGNLGAAWTPLKTYRAIFRALGEAGRPTFWVPGPLDAPRRSSCSRRLLRTRASEHPEARCWPG
jgi:hypothetical protein